MNYITGTHRHQTYFATLDDQVSADNAVRLIDAFVDKLELAKLGFTTTVHKSEGRPLTGRYANALLPPCISASNASNYNPAPVGKKSGEGERFITTINLSLSKEMINYDINFLDYLRVHRMQC